MLMRDNKTHKRAHRSPKEDHPKQDYITEIIQ